MESEISDNNSNDRNSNDLQSLYL